MSEGDIERAQNACAKVKKAILIQAANGVSEGANAPINVRMEAIQGGVELRVLAGLLIAKKLISQDEFDLAVAHAWEDEAARFELAIKDRGLISRNSSIPA